LTAGYSGTPLSKKLGIKSGTKIFLAHAPENYFELVAPLPHAVEFVSRITIETDIIHLFETEKASLAKALVFTLPLLRQNAAIWVSWPKRSSRLPTDITEDNIRLVALPLGLVDIKVCAVSDIWSGLKLVIRKENRKKL
jgi:hypothetical protein